MKLEGKVAIVTGGTRGIGKSIVERFLEEGAIVILGGSRVETAKKAEKECLEKYPNAQVVGVEMELTSTEKVEMLISKIEKEYGKIDILVNNAGITTTQSILELTDSEFDQVMQLDVYGIMRMTRAVSRVMVKQKSGGSIINTASMVGIYGSPRQPAYSCAKAAVLGFRKACAKEWGHQNIRVNAVAPGVVGTDMVKENVSDEMLES